MWHNTFVIPLVCPLRIATVSLFEIFKTATVLSELPLFMDTKRMFSKNFVILSFKARFGISNKNRRVLKEKSP